MSTAKRSASLNGAHENLARRGVSVRLRNPLALAPAPNPLASEFAPNPLAPAFTPNPLASAFAPNSSSAKLPGWPRAAPCAFRDDAAALCGRGACDGLQPSRPCGGLEESSE
eukprot:6189803-Pleurochrysis_carterae.AAC.4